MDTEIGFYHREEFETQHTDRLQIKRQVIPRNHFHLNNFP